VTRLDRTDAQERHARIEAMIEAHQAIKDRQLLQRTLKRRHRTETHQQLAAFEAQPERIH
jgi:hypothetical protein